MKRSRYKYQGVVTNKREREKGGKGSKGGGQGNFSEETGRVTISSLGLSVRHAKPQ